MGKRKVLDLFSGIGGFSLAFNNEGFDVVAAIDHNKKACEIYAQNLKNVNVICNDICNVDVSLLPDIDLLIGNILIPRFSTVRNKERNDNDINQCVYRIIESKKPETFVLEASYGSKNRLEEPINVLLKQGYHICHFLANSEVITGKPLVEKRIYLIGTKKELSSEAIVLKQNAAPTSLRDIMQEDDMFFGKYLLDNYNRKIKILDPDTDKVTCNFCNIPYVETSYGLRRITVREYARLKGYPDEYLLDDKNIWQTYKMVLSSTNVTVARMIAQSLKKYFAKDESEVERHVLQQHSKKSKKDLTNSQIDRQNILNNELALQEIQDTSNMKGILFESKLFFTKNMVATFFEVDVRTIERYVATNESELKKNGYELLKGKRLKEFKECIASTDILDEDKNTINAKTTQLAVFDFKAFLNMAMLLAESENARILRQTMLNIVIDFINRKTGGSTTYVNQRDRAFLSSYLQEDDYRKEFTDALRDYVDMGQFKYALFTDKIYQSIFKENAREYREILQLKKKDRTRETFYSEILDLIASYECGLAECIKNESMSKGRLLTNWETQKIFNDFENLPHWKPLIVSARTKMASRDLALRDAFHQQLQMYIKPLEKDEYERFLGSEAEQIARLMDENRDVLKRLKERE
ncbi:MAG: DNA cytosine methyltransferase [Lachnospiraceae bacterium]|nr:DNA cytosine methyltransferase [Lachnospiraceae bacterium]